MPRHLGSDERGVTVIEFAFIAPLLVLFVLGIVDGGRALSEKLTIDQAVYRGLEKVSVGAASASPTTGLVDYTFAKTEAATAAGVPSSQVTLTTWTECDGTKMPNFSDTCVGNDSTGKPKQTVRYVQLAITKSFVPSFPYGRYFLGADSSGNVAMSTSSAVRVQ
ncbi:MAG TPA: TadE/TadG family type IV pilus assembly protein [Allosphingosinicella sp.]|nr:TadE/TadG family type IV pilus assembly protein [Allosphingosinicella sp.]